MRNPTAGATLALAAVLVLPALLAAPAGAAAPGDEVQRLHCIQAGDGTYSFEGCVTYVLNQNGKRVATGYADDAGDQDGQSNIVVRVTHLRLQRFVCGGSGWETVRHRPSRNGWFDREYERTRPSGATASGVRWRAKASFAWKYQDGEKLGHRTVATKSKGTCP